MANHETLTISDINQYLAEQTPQVRNFNCVAAIEDVVPIPLRNSTVFPAYSSEIEHSDPSLVCTNDECKKQVCPSHTTLVSAMISPSAHPDQRDISKQYRFEFVLRDLTGATTFVISSATEKKFGAQTAASIPLEFQPVYDANGAHYGDVPNCLLYAIGCTYTFNIKLTPYNFIARQQPMLCTRIHGAVTDVKFE